MKEINKATDLFLWVSPKKTPLPRLSNAVTDISVIRPCPGHIIVLHTLFIRRYEYYLLFGFIITDFLFLSVIDHGQKVIISDLSHLLLKYHRKYKRIQQHKNKYCYHTIVNQRMSSFIIIVFLIVSSNIFIFLPCFSALKFLAFCLLTQNQNYENRLQASVIKARL